MASGNLAIGRLVLKGFLFVVVSKEAFQLQFYWSHAYYTINCLNIGIGYIFMHVIHLILKNKADINDNR